MCAVGEDRLWVDELRLTGVACGYDFKGVMTGSGGVAEEACWLVGSAVGLVAQHKMAPNQSE